MVGTRIHASRDLNKTLQPVNLGFRTEKYTANKTDSLWCSHNGMGKYIKPLMANSLLLITSCVPVRVGVCSGIDFAHF